MDMPSIPLIREPVRSAPPIPAHILRQFEEQRLREEARVASFGKIRETVQIPDFAGYRFVAVRNRLLYSKKWRFLTDFLFEYGAGMFGLEWP